MAPSAKKRKKKKSLAITADVSSDDDNDEEDNIKQQQQKKKKTTKQHKKKAVVEDGLKWSQAHDRLISLYKKYYDSGEKNKMAQIVKLLNRTVAQCHARMNVLFLAEGE